MLLFFQTAKISDTGADDAFPRIIKFPAQGYFGLIKGDIVYRERCAHSSVSCRLPTVLRLDLINPTKRKNLLCRLIAEQPQSDEFTEQLMSSEEIILFRGVEAYLVDATIK